MSKRKKKKSIVRRIGHFIRISIIILSFIGAVFCAIVVAKLTPIFEKDYEEAKEVISDKNSYTGNQASYIYDKDGNVIAELSSEGETEYLKYEDIPENVVNAFVAIEDNSFWSHKGIDIKGIIRVAYDYVKTGGQEIHGASTITQQLMRNIFLTKEVTIDRKIKEICYALRFEQVYSKSDIMEFYVNSVYFGNQYYGIGAAAKGYFNKDAKDLTLSEIAYLCAIPNRPSYYDPIKNKDNAIDRRNKILKDMYKLGYIGETDYEEAKNEEIVLDTSATKADSGNTFDATYAIHNTVEYLMKLDGFDFKYEFASDDDLKKYETEYEDEYELQKSTLYTKGYKIYTSIDKDIQDRLQNEINDVLSFDSKKGDDGIFELQGAATCIDNRNGNVVAIVGGREQDDITNYLNRAYQSYRQPGSSIKPLIVYTPFIEMGNNPNTEVQNIDIDTFDKTGEKTGNTMTIKNAVEQSINGVAYNIFSEVKPKVGLKYLMNMNFDKIVPNDYNLASALGGLTYGVTTEEMAGAYHCLENDGTYTSPTCILKIEDTEGNDIFNNEDAGTQIYDKYAARTMIDLMKGVIKEGTAKSMKWNQNLCEAAGKTGTTNDSKDGWFCGVTPYYSMSVWVGYDTPKKLSSLYGATYPAQIWKEVMEKIVTDAKELDEGDLSNAGLGGSKEGGTGTIDEAAEETEQDGTASDSDISGQVEAIINQIGNIDKSDTNWTNDINSLYNEAKNAINNVSDPETKNTLNDDVNNAYDKKLGE